MKSRKERMARFEGDYVHLTIYGHHIELTDGLKDTVRERLEKVLQLMPDRHVEVMVALEQQKLDHRCAIVLKSDGLKVKVQADTTDMYTSIDMAARKLETKVLRYKDRIQDYHRLGREVREIEIESVDTGDRELAEINAEIAAQTLRKQEEELHHPVVSRNSMVLKTLALEEAVMKMDLSADPFLIYRSVEDGGIRVIFRRKDGCYGVVQPQ
jgi:putative sigma-54 modulation protein